MLVQCLFSVVDGEPTLGTRPLCILIIYFDVNIIAAGKREALNILSNLQNILVVENLCFFSA